MEIIVDERGIDMGGQRPCIKDVLGLVSNMFRYRIKYLGN